MLELEQAVAERLKELFKDEKQQTTAKNLNTTQGNVSKWRNGTTLPPTETLFYIAKKYHVSIDWLLGLSDRKEIDSISINDLTYEQISLMLHRLIGLGIIEIPDLNQFDPLPEEEEAERAPNYDHEFIKVNDRALSFILRRRLKLSDIGEEYLETWIDTVVTQFNGVKLIENNETIHAALDSQSWATYKAGDWAALYNKIIEMTPEQIEAMANKEKEGKNNG